MRGAEALEKLLNEYDFNTVLDVGSGDGRHADIFKQAGKEVTTLDIAGKPDILGNFIDVPLGGEFDVIWACHVLEHQPNVGEFLKKVLYNSKIAVITVPPAKHNIVGGHLTLWNAGLLLYNMILAGFDCHQAKVKSYGYNISVICETKKRPMRLDLKYDCGDIETLAPYFPFDAFQGFDGQIEGVNW